MTHAHRNRPAKLPDLTRWNRAGLSGFDYVDGDAAVWLEELRIAMLGLYMEGAEPETRTPEHWRDAWLNPDPTQWPDAAKARARLKWKRLASAAPPQPESRGRRTRRLLEQYGQQSDDYGWEINRAMARASHVLLGTLNAYANEGYLRSATQWDNLRRLAAMVNYQPTPPASATTTLALWLKGETGHVEIPRGLAMKYTPPEGGAPLIFETLQAIQAHSALNGAHAVQWNENHHPISLAGDGGPKTVTWHLSAKDSLAPGDLVVIAHGASGHASAVDTVLHDTDAGLADVLLTDAPAKDLPHWPTRLHASPDDVRLGQPKPAPGYTSVYVPGGGYVAGDLVWVEGFDAVEVLDVTGGELVLDFDPGDLTEVSLLPMLPFGLDGYGEFAAPDAFETMYFSGNTGVTGVSGEEKREDDEVIAYTFPPPASLKTERGFVRDTEAKALVAKIKPAQPDVVPGKPGLSDNTVSFDGKTPKGLAEGNWFAARDIRTDKVKALQVRGVRSSSGEFHVLFSDGLDGAPEDTEFHGPMALALAARGYDRNPDRAMDGGNVTLQDVPEDARLLLKPGHKVIITRVVAGLSESQMATITNVTPLNNDRIKLALDPVDVAANWKKGDTTFYLNTVGISHGETKDARILGSGDGELPRQVFELALTGVSHIPSSATEAGVIPDLDITVDGERWDYRDFIDPSAEETRSWSTTLTDEGRLRVHFRRRLLTGQNNVRIVGVRVGAGIKGTGIPPFSFEKPMKKDRYVSGCHQPFPTSGGADREPVSKLRTSAPSRLSANGRAVSLSDFESLATRHASVLRAHAEEVPTPDAIRKVVLTLAPVGGGALTDTLRDDLRPAVLEKAVPGTRVDFRLYQTLPLHVSATVRADLTVHDRTDIKAAAEDILFRTFSLGSRNFAQTTYVSEVLAALETVDGIENATVTRFDLGDGYDLSDKATSPVQDPWPRNIAIRDGVVAAIYATDHQITHIPAESVTRVSVVVEDIR